MREKKLSDTVKKISEYLTDEPHALTLDLVYEYGKNFYNWRVNNAKARKIRGQARRLLKALWQLGDYNYQEIADKLRVQALDIQALLDRQFREKHGIR